tara:strand:+ start:52 stop:387 length:336 start_codon:yes stop_codon:yes gene_type:complete
METTAEFKNEHLENLAELATVSGFRDLTVEEWFDETVQLIVNRAMSRKENYRTHWVLEHKFVSYPRKKSLWYINEENRFILSREEAVQQMLKENDFCYWAEEVSGNYPFWP